MHVVDVAVEEVQERCPEHHLERGQRRRTALGCARTVAPGERLAPGVGVDAGLAHRHQEPLGRHLGQGLAHRDDALVQHQFVALDPPQEGGFEHLAQAEAYLVAPVGLIALFDAQGRGGAGVFVEGVRQAGRDPGQGSLE